MTFYVILEQFPAPTGWYPLDFGPDGYLTMKYKMQELRKENPGIKYKLIKTKQHDKIQSLYQKRVRG